MSVERRQAVIIGVGESIDRPVDIADALDPAGLMISALSAAERDAGVGLVSELDRLEIINEISWPYVDPCEILKMRLGRPDLDARYHPVGGQTPTLAIHEAALAIERGEFEIVAVCGGEAEESVRRARRQQVVLPWPPAVANFKPIRGGDFQSSIARALELTSPINVYPLYENAAREAWGQSLADGQRESATIWANNAAIARTRSAAWITRSIDVNAILSDDNGNRLIAWPYRKLMVANPIVNQGAAVILTSLGRARAMGVAEANIVYVHGGAAGDEPRDILARQRYDGSSVMEAVIHAALKHAPDGFDAVELYSCFPCVPKMARRTLRLDETVPLSVAGGLTFFGAPLNNYMTHAVAAMVDRLRVGGGRALLYGQGEYVTKHHALVLGNAPPEAALNEDFRVTTVEKHAAQEAPPLSITYRGSAVIETHTVLFDRNERPRHGVVIARTPANERIATRVDASDFATIAHLLGNGPIVGTSGMISDGEDGVPCWRRA